MGQDTAQLSGSKPVMGEARHEPVVRAETESEDSVTELEGGQADSDQEPGSAPGRRQVGETNTHALNSSGGQKTS